MNDEFKKFINEIGVLETRLAELFDSLVVTSIEEIRKINTELLESVAVPLNRELSRRINSCLLPIIKALSHLRSTTIDVGFPFYEDIWKEALALELENGCCVELRLRKERNEVEK